MLILLGNSLAPTLRQYFKARVSDNSHVQLLPASLGKFTAGQAFSEHLDNVEGQSVVLLQSLGSVDNHSTNDFAMQALFEVAELKRNKAKAVWVVAPYAGYSRQDRAVDERNVSQGMDTYAQLLKAVGSDGFSTIHMHSDAGIKAVEQHFGEERVFDLSTSDLFASYARDNLDLSRLSVGGPDDGAHDFAAAIAQTLGIEQFHFKKRHTGVSDTEVTAFEGNVRGGATLTADDEIDTAGTITNAQDRLRREGAEERYIAASHAVFSHGGLERAFTAGVQGQRLANQIIVTDTIDSGLERGRLRRQYDGIDNIGRIVVLETGPMLWDHVTKDIFNHPAMTAEGG